MKNIKITNWKGNEFSGLWNEKIYDSKLDDKELVRIFLNNEQIHITKEMLATITSDIAKVEAIKTADKSLQNKIKVKDFLEDMSDKDKLEIASKIMFQLIQNNSKFGFIQKAELQTALNAIMEVM